MDLTYQSAVEAEAMKRIYTTCKTCSGKFTAWNGEDECDDCYNIRKSHEVGGLTLKVSPSQFKGTWECTLTFWDLGVPFGYGNSIQEAIDAFLQAVADDKDMLVGYLQYQYTWS